MELEINTPQKTIYHDRIDMLRVPGSKGPFQILKNHSPIISTLVEGKITIRDKQKNTVNFDITDGILECSNNKIVILVSKVEASC